MSTLTMRHKPPWPISLGHINVEVCLSADNEQILQLQVMHASAAQFSRCQQNVLIYRIIEDYAIGYQQLPKALHVDALALVAVEVDSRIFEQVYAVVCIHVL